MNFRLVFRVTGKTLMVLSMTMLLPLLVCLIYRENPVPFLLAIAISFPFYVYGLRGFPLLVVAGIICFGFACTDEFHQSMVEGRGPSKRDVAIDCVGAFFGIMLVRIVCFTALLGSGGKKKKRRKRRR